MRRRGDFTSVWLSVHRIGSTWVLGVIAAWGSLIVFAAITIPLKYPYEARGELVDSGVVVGLVLPVAVMAVILDEGPPHLVACASRKLSVSRLILCAALLSAACALGAITSYAADLPQMLVVTDSALIMGLNILGVTMLGAHLGWALPAAVSFAASAPGLVPWELNALYRVHVGWTYLAVVGFIAVLASLAMARYGALGLPGRRQVRQQFEGRTD